MSVYDENGVPVVYRGPNQKIGLSKQLKHDPDELLLGESVVIHCKRLRGTNENGSVTFSIGAENLDEALKSVIGAFDVHHLEPAGQSSDAEHPPDWVASTHKELGKALADYYSCDLLDIAEVF